MSGVVRAPEGDRKARAVEHRMREFGVSRWPLNVIGGLLLLEATGLAAAGTLNFTSPVLGELIPALRPWGTPVAVGFLVLAPLALAAAVGFFRLWEAAWLIAMMLQGLSLAVSLALYLLLEGVPGYLYAVMAYSTVMVFYLNSQGIRASFRPGGRRRA